MAPQVADDLTVPGEAVEIVLAALWKPRLWWLCDTTLAMLVGGVVLLYVAVARTQVSIVCGVIIGIVGLVGLQALGRHDPHARFVYLRSALYGKRTLAARAVRGQRPRQRIRRQ